MDLNSPAWTALFVTGSLLRHLILGCSVGIIFSFLPFRKWQRKSSPPIELSSRSLRHKLRLYNWMNGDIRCVAKKHLRFVLFLWLASGWVLFEIVWLNQAVPTQLTVSGVPLLAGIGLLCMPLSLWFGTKKNYHAFLSYAKLTENINSDLLDVALASDDADLLDVHTPPAPVENPSTRRRL